MSGLPATIAYEMLGCQWFLGNAVALGATYFEGKAETIQDRKESFLAQTVAKVMIAASWILSIGESLEEVKLLTSFFIAPILADALIQNSELPEEVKVISGFIAGIINVAIRVESAVFFIIGAGMTFGGVGVFCAMVGVGALAHQQLTTRTWSNFFSPNAQINETLRKAMR